MVFLTALNLSRNPAIKIGRPGGGTDKFWRVQQMLRFSWKFTGRKRNCFGIAMRSVHKALMYATIARQLRKKDYRELWTTRLDAAGIEHGIDVRDLMEGLARCNIQLDRKVLNDIAIYEPRTFHSLTEVAKKTLDEQGVGSLTALPRYIPTDSHRIKPKD